MITLPNDPGFILYNAIKTKLSENPVFEKIVLPEYGQHAKELLTGIAAEVIKEGIYQSTLTVSIKFNKDEENNK